MRNYVFELTTVERDGTVHGRVFDIEAVNDQSAIQTARDTMTYYRCVAGSHTLKTAEGEHVYTFGVGGGLPL